MALQTCWVAHSGKPERDLADKPLDEFEARPKLGLATADKFVSELR